VEKLSTRETLELLRATCSYDPHRDVWSFTLPRLLRSPNETLWRHWRVKQRERLAWEALLLAALLDVGGYGRPYIRRRVYGDRVTLEAPPRRVVIERWLARPQQMIRDVDNLAFSGKHVVDALVRVGLLRDDSPAWAERPAPTQSVSADGRAYTVIRLEPLASKL